MQPAGPSVPGKKSADPFDVPYSDPEDSDEDVDVGLRGSLAWEGLLPRAFD